MSMLNQELSNTMNDNYLLQKQLELVIETNTKRVIGEFGNIAAMFSKLNQDIIDLKRQIAELSAQRPAAAVSATAQTPAMSNAADRRSQSSVNQRCGNYTSDDVSIHKFFDFGKRK